MAQHTCSTIIITCIDFRFQKHIDRWIADNLEVGDFDRVAIAGGVYDFKYAFEQIAISHKLHAITKVILVNHEDCGAYGEEGTLERHTSDLQAAAQKIRDVYPDIDVTTRYIKLDGTFDTI